MKDWRKFLKDLFGMDFGKISEQEKNWLSQWADECQRIASSDVRQKEKFKKLFGTMKRYNKVLKPVFKLIWGSSKKVFWQDRSTSARVAILGVLGGIIAGGGVGLAICGTAVGIPLFLLTGAGGAFLGVLIEELTKRKREE